MSLVAKYTLQVEDGEYINYIYSSHSFIENKRLDNFFKAVEEACSDPYDGYTYELHLHKKIKHCDKGFEL